MKKIDKLEKTGCFTAKFNDGTEVKFDACLMDDIPLYLDRKAYSIFNVRYEIGNRINRFSIFAKSNQFDVTRKEVLDGFFNYVRDAEDAYSYVGYEYIEKRGNGVQAWDICQQALFDLTQAGIPHPKKFLNLLLEEKDSNYEGIETESSIFTIDLDSLPRTMSNGQF